MKKGDGSLTAYSAFFFFSAGFMVSSLIVNAMFLQFSPVKKNFNQTGTSV
jgi:hypothetical protein